MFKATLAILDPLRIELQNHRLWEGFSFDCILITFVSVNSYCLKLFSNKFKICILFCKRICGLNKELLHILFYSTAYRKSVIIRVFNKLCSL